MARSMTYRFKKKDYLEMYIDLSQAGADKKLSPSLKKLKDECERKLIGTK